MIDVSTQKQEKAIQYNTIHGWRYLFLQSEIYATAILNSWRHLDFCRYFSTPDHLSVAKEEMQFYISKYTHSCVSNTFTSRLCIKISGIIQLLKFSMLCAMYLLISYIQVIHIRLKNLLDIEIDTLTEAEPLHQKTLYTFPERSKGCLSHNSFLHCDWNILTQVTRMQTAWKHEICL